MEIVRLSLEDRKSLTALYRKVTADLRSNGVHQWDWLYPNRFVIGGDLKRGTAFGIRDGGRVVGAVVLDRRQSGKYADLKWADQSGHPMCIHRLAVDPEFQGQGIGKRLLRFAEEQALATGGTSIRLDVYTGNPGAVGMYRRAGYSEVGEIRYPMRKESYLCLEKRL
jgi:ribosomal protein S18 acetylase RimI-like enzyme